MTPPDSSLILHTPKTFAPRSESGSSAVKHWDQDFNNDILDALRPYIFGSPNNNGTINYWSPMRTRRVDTLLAGIFQP